MLKTILLAVSLVLTSGSAWSADLRIGTSADYPPWSSIDTNGAIVGFDKDVGDAVCKRIGANCTWQNQAYEGLLPGLVVGKFDLVISGISITAERAKKVDFTSAYADAPNSVAVLAGSPIAESKSREDLENALQGKTIGVQTGTTHEAVVRKHMGDATVQVYDRTDQLADDLRAGRIDAGLMERSAWESLFKNSTPPLAYAGQLLSSADYSEFGKGQAIVLAKNKAELKASLDKAISELLADGTVASLSQKWFNYDLSYKTR